MSDSNKLVGLDSLSYLANQIKANIKKDLLGDKKLRYVTLDEYEALSDDEKNNNSIVWNIIDADDLILNDYSTQVDWNETDPESPRYILNKPNLDAILNGLNFTMLEFDTTDIVFDSNFVPPSEPDEPNEPSEPDEPDMPSEPDVNTLQVVYSGGNKEYGKTTIEDLRPYLAVTAYYADGTKKENVTDYEITGELNKGQNSLTVSYRGKTATFTVYLETKIYTIQIRPVPSDAKVMIDGSNVYSKNVEGGTTVTYEVSKDGYKTVTREIVVTENKEITVELVVAKTISAVRANWSGPQIPYGSTLDNLRQYLEVKAEYPDGSSEIVTDYELSGELKKNSNNKITVTYEGKTVDFYVWVQVVIYTVNITANPSDATVILNGRNSRSENVESGTTVTYEVSKNGYITVTGEIVVTKNENITIILVEET